MTVSIFISHFPDLACSWLSDNSFSRGLQISSGFLPASAWLVRETVAGARCSSRFFPPAGALFPVSGVLAVSHSFAAGGRRCQVKTLTEKPQQFLGGPESPLGGGIHFLNPAFE
jgi:hypothetical protein